MNFFKVHLLDALTVMHCTTSSRIAILRQKNNNATQYKCKNSAQNTSIDKHYCYKDKYGTKTSDWSLSVQSNVVPLQASTEKIYMITFIFQ